MEENQNTANTSEKFDYQELDIIFNSSTDNPPQQEQNNEVTENDLEFLDLNDSDTDNPLQQERDNDITENDLEFLDLSELNTENHTAEAETESTDTVVECNQQVEIEANCANADEVIVIEQNEDVLSEDVQQTDVPPEIIVDDKSDDVSEQVVQSETFDDESQKSDEVIPVDSVDEDILIIENENAVDDIVENEIKEFETEIQPENPVEEPIVINIDEEVSSDFQKFENDSENSPEINSEGFVEKQIIIEDIQCEEEDTSPVSELADETDGVVLTDIDDAADIEPSVEMNDSENQEIASPLEAVAFMQIQQATEEETIIEDPEDTDEETGEVQSESENEDETPSSVITVRSIDDTRGFYLAENDDRYALFGYVNDEIVLLKEFENLFVKDMGFRFEERTADSEFYLVKVNNTKLLVEVTADTMMISMEF